MCKKVIISLLLSLSMMVVSTQSVSALGLDYGIRVGANMSSIRSLSDDINIGSGWGFQTGAYVGLDFALFAITPELNYSRSSATYDAQKIGGQFGNLVFETLDVPILFSMSVLGPLKLKAGPSFTLWSRAQLPESDIYYNVKSSYGYVAGLGLEFSNIGVDVRYNGSFSSTILPIGEVNNSSNIDYKIRASSISVLMSYSF